MNSIFNLPQDITTTGNTFARNMFSGCDNTNFRVNSVFKFPQDLNSDTLAEATVLADVFKDVIAKQTRTAADIIGSISNPSSVKNTFTNAIGFSDYKTIDANWRDGSDLEITFPILPTPSIRIDYVGETLTNFSTISGVNYHIDARHIDVGDETINFAGATFPIRASWFGKTTDNGPKFYMNAIEGIGTKSSAQPLAIPARPEAPSAPAAPASANIAARTITLTAISGCEYSKDGGDVWQTSPTFTGLSPETTYIFCARKTAVVDTSFASLKSMGVSVTTAEGGNGEGEDEGKDTDGDGYPDGWEKDHGYDPENPEDKPEGITLPHVDEAGGENIDFNSATGDITMTLRPTTYPPLGLAGKQGNPLNTVPLAAFSNSYANNNTDINNIPGQWKWMDEMEKMTAEGNNQFKAKFTPTAETREQAVVTKIGVVTLYINYIEKQNISVIVTVAAAKDEIKNNTAAIPPVYLKTPIKKLSVVVKKKLKLKKMIGIYDKANKPAKTAIIWTSSKPNVAKVDRNGTVKAGKKKGKTVIIVKPQSGAVLKITITVAKKAKKLKKLTGKVPKMKVKKPVYITLKGTGTNISKYKFKVKGVGKGKKKGAAKVDKFGMITGTKKGTVQITVTAAGKKWVKKVTIK